jgi:glutamate synthase (NADPH/NADH) small chain
MLGHNVVVFNRDAKLGGLNEFGIAAYKTVDDFAQREVEWILAIGGIEVRDNVALGRDVSLASLRDEYDAVFLGMGLELVNELGIEGETTAGVENAVDYIGALRQAQVRSELPVGGRVVVVGGGMTAIDVAVQSKRLGAERVDVVYRRGPAQMGASRFEQELAQTNGVSIHYWSQPTELLGEGHVTGIVFERTEQSADGQLEPTGETVQFEADVVFKAIGQKLNRTLLDAGIDFARGKIAVDLHQRTSLDDVWAGGDCVASGDDLTVTAVQHGKVAAIAIDSCLRDN